MNWNAIGAIAELLGAIGVIVSLVYLALQIRDSQKAVCEIGQLFDEYFEHNMRCFIRVFRFERD